MVPVEFLWLVLILFWGLIGSARGLAKELGATSILVLSLFTLFVVWGKFISKAVDGGGVGGTPGVPQAAFFGVAIVLVAYLSYEGVVLAFPIKQEKGLLKTILGFFGGLLNGYLIVGTIWDVLAQANYFQPKLGLVGCCVSELHGTIAKWLPLMLMERSTPFAFLIPGMFLLLLIIMK